MFKALVEFFGSTNADEKRRSPEKKKIGKNREERGGDWRGRVTQLLFALDIRTLTPHPYRGGAPFLLQTETPPKFGRLA